MQTAAASQALLDQAQTDAFDEKIDKVVADGNKKVCSDGTFYSKAKKECAASTLQLAKTATACTASANGLVVLDGKGKPAVCNGAKEKYQALGSGGAGASLRGLTEDAPAASCAAIEKESVFVLKTAQYWVTRDGVAVQTICVFEAGADAADAGGDGSSAAQASADCLSLFTYHGIKKPGSYYLRGKGNTKQECTFVFLGAPKDKLSLEGQVNKYAYIVTDSINKGSVTFDIAKPNDVAKGDNVMIHQTMTVKEGTEGQWEWNVVKSIEDHPNTQRYDRVTLMVPTKRSYMSGNGNGIANTRVAQLITAPYAKVAIVTGKVTAGKWDGFKGGIVAIRTTKSLTINGNIDAQCVGFRGGKSHHSIRSSGSCQAHQSAGFQGESFRGLGKRDKQSGGFGCCGGPANMYNENGYRGRGKNNFGGGGGGAGACHGGGGAGGAHGDWAGVERCNFRCRKGEVGDGAPECSRAGSWAMRGKPYGDGIDVVNFGSGGGAGNSYSPRSNEDNRVRASCALTTALVLVTA